MQHIEMATWARREHFALFRGLDHPYFGVSLELEVGAWVAAIRAAKQPFYPSLVHQVSAAANAVEAFRLRVRGEGAVLHDRVHPSFTVPWRDELFNFCVVDFHPDREAFLAACLPAMRHAQNAPKLLLDDAHRDDQIFLSCLPWVSFTGLVQVGDAKSGDSFPRIAWGKLREVGAQRFLPLNVQLHHAVADGVHLARFVAELEEGLAREAARLGGEALQT